MAPAPVPADEIPEGAPSDDEVLARYDRYLREFLEPLNVCPYSKRARENALLGRAVLRGGPTEEAVVEALLRVTDAPPDKLEVAVLILPDIPLEASPFMRFVSRVREKFTRVSVPRNGFFLVAMHPGHNKDLSTPERAVAFMRRTPHPSIQVARAEVILAARGYTPPGEESVSDRVARLGLQSVLKMGEADVEALLTRIRDGR